MSQIDQVLAAAKALADRGKLPSVALLKAQLSNSIPLPILIKGLQQFKAMPKAEQARLVGQVEVEAEVIIADSSPEQAVARLTQELKQLKAAYQQLDARLTRLESQEKTA
ncbi:hypothetical protein LZP73_02700 [Shewanella sp. AS16]|uniref:hypothetical protein n=1 Tax=Shewanella sp. AS16 TaxID=2907625 RepID=UPI001F2A4CC7|nr:hypothetical protein [Shewanella sp. AS16]MCE9685121.1 hypothetical protein [Shewanella sp. AS16]